MKKLFLLTLFFVSISSFSFAEIRATIDPLDIGIGTRALGMGKAFTAVADDANCIFLNPAGLASVNNWGATSMYTSLLSEITFTSFSIYRSSSMEGVGIGYAGASLGGEIYTAYRDPVTSRIIPAGLIAAGYTSNVIVFSYGLSPGKYIDLPIFDRISAGVSLKTFFQQLKGASEDASASGYDMDVGMVYKANDWLNLGVYGQDILPVSAGGVLRWNTGVEENIPASYKFGLSAKALGSKAFWEYSQDLFINLDFQGSFQHERPLIYHTGVEWWLQDYLALRMGLDQDVYAKVNGNGIDNNLTFGIGLWRGDFGFDYAYHQYGPLSENASHYFSMSYGFFRPGLKGAEVEPEEKPQEVKPAAGDAIKISEPQDKYVTYNEIINVSGDILRADIVTIEVNGNAAAILKDAAKGRGAFSYKYKLPDPGKHLIKVVCFNDKGEVLGSYKIRVVRYPSFTDVPDNYWARDKISILSLLNLAGGYPDGSFKPEKIINRAELITLLVKAKGTSVTGSADTSFTDVKKGHWASAYIKSGVEDGFATGYPDKTFKPSKSVSRAEGVTIISRFAGIQEPDFIAEGPFPDVPGRHWAVKSILGAKSAGLLMFLVDKPFEPSREMTRAEAAELLSQTKLAKDKVKGFFNWDEGF